MKTYEQFITETNTTRAVSIAARLKGGINRLKAKMPGTQANKIQAIRKRIDPKTYHESKLEEGRARSGKARTSQWASSENGVDNEVVNRKVRKSVKAAAKTGAYNDAKNIKDPRFAKVDHYINKSNKRYNSNFYVKPGRIGEDEQLGPNAVAVQKTRKNLGIKEGNDLYEGGTHEDDLRGILGDDHLKNLKNSKLFRSRGKRIYMSKVTYGNRKMRKISHPHGGPDGDIPDEKIPKYDHYEKHQKDREIGSLHKMFGTKPKTVVSKKKFNPKRLPEAEAESPKPPKPEPKKINRLKYFLDRAKRKATVGENETIGKYGTN